MEVGTTQARRVLRRRALAWAGVLGAVVCLGLAGCGGGGGGGGAVRAVGSAKDAAVMVQTVAEAAQAAVDSATVEGNLANVTVGGLLGTATLNGRLLHTQSFNGVTTADNTDADLTITFVDFRIQASAGTATVNGTVQFQLGTPTPGAGFHFFPPDSPITISGNVAASYQGADSAADSFSFDAGGKSVTALDGTLTTLSGTKYQFIS